MCMKLYLISIDFYDGDWIKRVTCRPWSSVFEQSNDVTTLSLYNRQNLCKIYLISLVYSFVHVMVYVFDRLGRKDLSVLVGQCTGQSKQERQGTL